MDEDRRGGLNREGIRTVRGKEDRELRHWTRGKWRRQGGDVTGRREDAREERGGVDSPQVNMV